MTKIVRKSLWKCYENSFTYCYVCPDCGFGCDSGGFYDGVNLNQKQHEFCPRCNKAMFEEIIDENSN